MSDRVLLPKIKAWPGLVFFLFLSCFGLPTRVCSQAWSGIIAPNRATDWSSTGAVIPTNYTQCTTAACNNLATPANVTAANVNSAISSASANTYVLLPAGSFSMNASLVFGTKNNVILRGAGANSTFLTFTSSGCPIASGVICLGSSGSYIGRYFPPDNVAAVSTTALPRGTTQFNVTTPITHGNISNLSAGQYIFIDQCDDGRTGATASDGMATCATGVATDTGNIFMCSMPEGPCPASSGEAGGNRPGRGQGQALRVTAVNGNTITVQSPGLYMPNWNSGKNVEIFWSTYQNHDIGVESLSIDFSSSGSSGGAVVVVNCHNCWVKGIRSIYTGSGTQRDHVWFILSPHATVKDSYFYGSASSTSEGYGVECFMSGDDLIENNIFQHIPAPQLWNADCEGCVTAYNFSVDHRGDGTNMWDDNWLHANTAMTLAEGNIGTAYRADWFHGTHAFGTAFRNYYVGWEPNRTGLLFAAGFNNYSRYMNAVGNVLGHQGTASSYTGQSGSIYWLDTDALMQNSLLRWGNYDVVNNAVRFLSSENPSSFNDTSGSPSRYVNLPNPTQTLPASFYYTTKPSWWPATTPWPPIGPDVTGGTVFYSGGSTTWVTQSVGGHANANPALNCYKNLMGGPADGSGSPLNFNASNCYGTSSQPPPAAPTGLAAIVN